MSALLFSHLPVGEGVDICILHVKAGDAHPEKMNKCFFMLYKSQGSHAESHNYFK